jgi:hypothetical protein
MVYKLRRDIVGVYSKPEAGKRLVTIPTGAELDVPKGPLRLGIVEVIWQDRRVGVFLRDIKPHADKVDVTGKGGCNIFPR